MKYSPVGFLDYPIIMLINTSFLLSVVLSSFCCHFKTHELEIRRIQPVLSRVLNTANIAVENEDSVGIWAIGQFMI